MSHPSVCSHHGSNYPHISISLPSLPPHLPLGLPYPSPILFSIHAFVLFLQLFNLALTAFRSLVCVTVSFVSSPSVFLFLPNMSMAMDRKFLFTTGKAVPALLTNQQEGISTSDEPSTLAIFYFYFLTAIHVSLSCLCVFLCLCVSHTWVVVIIDRGLL